MTKYDIIVRPIVTEKALTHKEDASTLVFEVNRDANKTQIKQAVESLFKVKVADVRTSGFEGKLRRRGRYSGYRPDWKKAYVRLKSGEKLPEYLEA
jgi:large subunit ribosomal protein L23